MSTEKILFDAIKNNQRNIVEQYFAQGADVNVLNERGDSALMVAIQHSSYAVAEALLALGASMDTRDNDGQTALHWAVAMQDKKSIRLLMANNARPDCLDCSGQTPLILAKRNREIEQLLDVSISNYHAEKLDLRKNIALLMEDEDVISIICGQLKYYLSSLEMSYCSEQLNKIYKQLLQPEELLNFEGDIARSVKKSSPILQKPSFRIAKKRPNMAAEVDVKRFSTVDSEEKAKVTEVGLDESSAIFKNLNSVIQLIQELQQNLQLKKDKNFLEVYRLLERARLFYVDYRLKICQQNEMRAELFSGRARARGFLGHRYLNVGTELRFRTFFASEENPAVDLLMPRRDNEFGMHAVLQLHNTYYKVRPTAPAIEHAVDTLNKIISGQCSAPTELLVFEKGEMAFPVLASLAVSGENFAHVLSKKPEWLNYLDSYNYTAHFILTILTCPSDAKPDNFVARRCVDGNQVSVKLVGIDNDCAFNFPIMAYPRRGMCLGQRYLDLKTIFFCMDKIDSPLDPVFRRAFLDQLPELLTLKWLKELLIQENHYLDYQKLPGADDMSAQARQRHIRALFTEEEFKKIKLPIKFLPGTVRRVYQDLQRIQKILCEDPRISHHLLLKKLYAVVAEAYVHVREKVVSVEERIRYVYQDMPLLDELCRHDPGLMVELEQYTYTMVEAENAHTETLEQACHLFINELDYAQLPDVYSQGLVLEKIATEFQFIEDLVIKNCRALSDSRLENLAQGLKGLRSLTLINCGGVEGMGLSAMLYHHPEIALTLEEFSNISTLNLLNILQHCKKLSLVVLGQVYNAKEHAGDLLKFVSERTGYTSLMTALLMHGVHLTYGSGSESPLHLAAKRGQLFVVQELIGHGAPVNILNDKGESVLDVTYEGYKEGDRTKILEYQRILLLLIEKGALQCQCAQGILQSLAALTNKLPPKVLNPLFAFVRCHKLLTPQWVPLLLLPNLELLDIGVPSHFKFYDLVLTMELLQAIRKTLPHLKHLVLTGCSGLTKALLNDLLTWKLLSIEIDFKQAEICGVATLANLQDVANLSMQGTQLKITRFSLSGRKLTQDRDTLLKIGTFIRKSKDLTHLELINCQLHLEDITLLAGSVANNISLESLMLDRNPLQDDGVAIILNALQKHTRLRALSLDKTGAGINSAILIGKMLSQHATLEHLSLYKNPLKDAGVFQIAGGIQERTKKKLPQLLKTLILNDVEMGANSAVALSHALVFYTTLTTLDVGYNREIKNLGAQRFIELLQLNSYISTFKGDEIAIDDRLAAQLKTLARKNKQYCQDSSAAKHDIAVQAATRVQNALPSEYFEMRDLKENAQNLRQQLARIAPPRMSIGKTPQVNWQARPNSPLLRRQLTLKHELKTQVETLQAVGYQFGVKSSENSIGIAVVSDLVAEARADEINKLWDIVIRSLTSFGLEKVDRGETALRIECVDKGKLQRFLSLLEEMRLIPTIVSEGTAAISLQ